MKRLAVGALKQILKALAYGIAGGSVVLLVVAVDHLNGRPDLKVWHEAELESEYTAASKVDTFEGYLELEDGLFSELDEKVYGKIEPEDERLINRYHRDSLADPENWPRNWNRTFEFTVRDPVAAVLLLHGMSDSPYSLRTAGERFHAEGAWVVGLRIPGHGTAPSGLVEVEWEDMAAAVRLAMRHLKEKTGDVPIYIVGYSNGGALAVEYALSSLDDGKLPRAEGLILISPAIGVSPIASLAVWQGRLGWVLGMKKLSWNSVLPEYDPFKYNSFAVNAGHQVYRLTDEIRKKIEEEGSAGRLEDFPPVLAFQSAVDATVSTTALIANLFARLPNPENELVLFDINRRIEVEPLLRNDPTAGISAILADTEISFGFSLVTNENATSDRIVVRGTGPGQAGFTDTETAMSWPRNVYSLAHVSLPFTGDDPVYGGLDPNAVKMSPGIQLGNLAPRGERGILAISPSDMLRLRWNPFYDYLEEKLLEFTGMGSE